MHFGCLCSITGKRFLYYCFWDLRLVSIWSLWSLPKMLSSRCDFDRWAVSMRAGFHMITVIATIAEEWFPRDCYDCWTFFPGIVAIIAITWKPAEAGFTKLSQAKDESLKVRFLINRLCFPTIRRAHLILGGLHESNPSLKLHVVQPKTARRNFWQ